MLPAATVVVVIGAIIVIVALVYVNHLKAAKRRQVLAALAAKLGLRFSAKEDRAMAKQLSFLNRMQSGSNRYVFNSLFGPFKGNDVRVFEFHYETYSTDGKGHTSTQHHYMSFFGVVLPTAFPEITIFHEGLLSKFAQAFGYDDIDFESHEFSRQFCVRSTDKKFAYDVCNGQMIAFLLTNNDLQVEIDSNFMALIFDEQLDLSRVELNLERLITARSLLPDYLFQEK